MINEKKEKMKDIYVKQYTPAELNDAEKDIINFMGSVSTTVYRDYLPNISRNYKIDCLDWDIKETMNYVSFIELKKFVVDEETSIVDCLKTVYHVLAYSENSVGLIIRRKKNECSIGIAVGNSIGNRENTIKNMAQLRDALIGNFPGTQIKDYIAGDSCCTGIKNHIEDEESLLSVLNENYAKSLAIVSNVATELTDDFSIQGIEKLIDGIRPSNDNSEYTIVLLGESVDSRELVSKKDELFSNYSALSPYAQRQENWSIGEAKEWSSNWNQTVGGHGGVHFNTKIPIVGKAGSVDLGVDSHTGFGHTWGESINASNGGAVEIVNYKVKHTLEMLEKQMQRLEESEALGLWNFAAYVISPDLATTREVAHMYMSLTQGKESYYEKPAINIWDIYKADEDSSKDNAEQIRGIIKYLNFLKHPKFILRDKIQDMGYYPKFATATTTLSGIEFARALNLPGKSVPGFAVIKCAAFGREISSYDDIEDATINIGAIHHMHQNEELQVCLSKKSLTSHVFVTGSTGVGKSNTVYNLLSELDEKENVSFLVIEPTKGEYGYAFGNAKVYGTRPNTGDMLKMNPFAFSNGVHVFEHIDRILEVFNVCWPMYAAMPAVLKDAVIQSYQECGWDLKKSVNKKGYIYPTFEDVLDKIDSVIDSSKYSDENKGNYKGALSTRIQSLANGLNGLIFCDGNIPESELFDRNVIVDLSKIGSNETKSLIMGMLIIKLQEYRMSQGGINAELKHITVLEEAHNILKNTHVQGAGESSNIAAKSVEMISNSIAEMRTYGEGFVIVDQAPGLMDMSVIRNTNTKIIMRLPDQTDRELVGRAAGLSETQIEELSRLQKGVAAIYQNEWVEPVLCKIRKYNSSIENSLTEERTVSDNEAMKTIALCLVKPEYLIENPKVGFIDAVEKANLSGQLKANLLDYYRTPYRNKLEIWQKSIKLFFKELLEEVIRFNKSEENDSIELKKFIIDRIKNRYGVDMDGMGDGNIEYRFIQAVLCESIDELNTKVGNEEPDICRKIESCMFELREAHINGI